MMYGGVLTPNLPAAPPDQLSDGSSGLLQRRQTLTPLHSSSNGNATVLGNRLRQPPPGLTSGAASVAGPQPEARAKAASLAQTYMPVTRSDLRQFVRTRAETPQQLAEEGGSQPSAVERGVGHGLQGLPLKAIGLCLPVDGALHCPRRRGSLECKRAELRQRVAGLPR